jgi:succinate dehydrogenase/fumarate reductase flavoprotein subunit
VDNIYDVIVVGYGAAGAVSAITAYDNGASVIILEKMPNGGGNSRVSGGNIIIPK